jgi:hypothetical protein
MPLRVRTPETIVRAEEVAAGRVRDQRLLTDVAANGAVGSPADPPLVYRRWMFPTRCRRSLL